MTESSNETTDVIGPPAELDNGGLVAPATTPLPGSVEHDELIVVDPGMLPAPDVETRVDGLEHPIEPRRWTAGDIGVLAGRFVSVFWALSVMWMVVFALLPLLVGWTPTVVSTGSMEPAVSAGSIVHVDGDVDPQVLGSGSIITYEDPVVPGRTVSHRVIEVVRDVESGPTTGFRTKGDANGQADAAVVPVDAVQGATRLVLPYAGLPQVWLDEGRWWLVALLAVGTAVAAIIAFDTLGGYLTGRSMFRRRSVASAVAIAIAVMLGGPASNAAFAATTDQSGSTFASSTSWWLDVVDADGPVAHWQLDDVGTGGGSVTIVSESFEGANAFTQFGSGQVAASTAQARTGATSAHKTSNNDPNGAWSALPTTVTGSFTFDVWVYRPSSYSGGAVDRLGLEDATFGGYTFYADHSSNRLRIDRRTNGNATGLGSTVAFDPPEDEWYRLSLVRSGTGLSVSAFDGSGTLLATTSAVDGTYTTFDRWVVRGGHDYFVDDLTITQDAGPPAAAVDRVGTIDGTISGSVTSGTPTLLSNVPGTPSAFDFDGTGAVRIGDDPAINTSDRAERTVELWFEPDVTAGRQVLFEEGGGVNGLSLYLDGTTLYGRAWGQTLGWSNALEVATAVGAIQAGTTYHAAVVLDSVTDRSLELYLDGVLVGTATKTDSQLWHAHSDDGAIGQVNGGTQYHDGNSNGPDGFDGTIDEVVVFNSALDGERIQIHHTAGR